MILSINHSTPAWALTEGVYDDISNEEYHLDKTLVNGSSLKKILISPSHYYSKTQENSVTTQAKILGSATHCLILEPHLFSSQYVLEPERPDNPKIIELDKEIKDVLKQHKYIADGNKNECILRIKKYLPEYVIWSELRENIIANRKVLNPQDWETLHQMHRSYYEREDAIGLLKDAKIEQTMVWEDPETGIWLKARPDAKNHIAVSDMKTFCDPPTKRNFTRCLGGEYSYAFSAAMIVDGIYHLTGEELPFIWSVIEKNPPYSTVLFKATKKTIDYGRKQYRTALRQLANCLETNQWPGIQNNGSIEDIDPPFTYRN